MLLRVVSYRSTDVSEELTGTIITATMEAASTSERSVNFHHTARCNVPEGSRLNESSTFFIPELDKIYFGHEDPTESG
jgi:hypothetical protein